MVRHPAFFFFGVMLRRLAVRRQPIATPDREAAVSETAWPARRGASERDGARRAADAPQERCTAQASRRSRRASYEAANGSAAAGRASSSASAGGGSTWPTSGSTIRSNLAGCAVATTA